MPRGPILGIGVDLVENDRMAEMLEKWGDKFKNRVFLRDEQTYCDGKAFPSRHYAGRFAVKEAVSKAFGTGIGPNVGLLDIEVERNAQTGAPSVRLRRRAESYARERGVLDVLVSLSHTRHYAIAHALLVASAGETP